MMKAVSSIELGMDTLTHKPFEELTDDEIVAHLHVQDAERVFCVYEALKRGIDHQTIYRITKIDWWFLDKMQLLANLENGLAKCNGQMILDGPQRKGDLRRARAGAQNIVPNTTGAAKAIGLVIPELNGKLIGSAQRVPVPTGSTTILVAVVKGKDVTKESINAAMKAASSESFGYNEDQIVSSDVIGMRYGSLFDATQTMVAKIDDDTYQVQVVSWYDNENSYTSQMVRTIKYFAENC